MLNKTNLNQNFITKVGAEWTAKIDETTWKVGGNDYDNIASKPAKTAYQNEIVKPAPGNYSTNGDTEYKAQIGLMYASDYGFAAAPSAWTTDLKSYHINSIPNSNWMYMGIDEWTISRFAEFYTGVLYVNASGRLCNGSSNDALAVRPVFNLTSSVNYASGSGSATDPILVN